MVRDMETTQTIPQPPPLTTAELDAAFAKLARYMERLGEAVEAESE